MNMTIVVVTHELESAFKIADSITVLDHGRILMSDRTAAVRASEHPRIRALLDRTPRDDSVDADEYPWNENASRRSLPPGDQLTVKRDNINYLAVGSFVLAMGCVLLYGLYRVTGQSGKGDEYLTHFGNVAGIKVGSVVTFEGYEVGNVAAIEPVAHEGRTRYRVALNLRKPVAFRPTAAR